MSDNLLIRKLRENDFRSLLELRNNPDIYKWFKNPVPVSTEEHFDWMQERLSRYSELSLIAEINHACIGIAYLTFKELYFISISVKPEFQNQKIATCLLDSLLLNAKVLNASCIYDEIRELNASSINFFRKHGFKKIDSRIFNSDSDFELFELDLK